MSKTSILIASGSCSLSCLLLVSVVFCPLLLGAHLDRLKITAPLPCTILIATKYICCIFNCLFLPMCPKVFLHKLCWRLLKAVHVKIAAVYTWLGVGILVWGLYSSILWHSNILRCFADPDSNEQQQLSMNLRSLGVSLASVLKFKSSCIRLTFSKSCSFKVQLLA